MRARSSYSLALCLLATVLVGSRGAGAIELEDCQLVGPGGFGRLAARCGTLAVAENPDAPEGREIELFVAVVPALSRQAEPDAFTVIAGGPGQASSEFYVSVAGAFESIRRERDIVLVDQRGTGKSNALDCPEREDDPAPWESPSAERVLESTARCLAELPGDPRFYTTSVAVRDLDAVRRALGYEAWNLYGVSYGTRVALHHLRRFPDATRSVVLDGVAAPDSTLGPEISHDAQAALELMFERCAADAACAARFPDLRGAFAKLLARLRGQSVRLTIEDPLEGEPVRVLFGPDQLGLTIRLLSYTPAATSLLPILIWEATATGELERLASQALFVAQALGETMSEGMHNSVICTEDVPFYAGLPVDREAMMQDYLGSRGYDLLVQICELWPRGTIDPDFKTPVVSDRPVLLLSGAIDPVTPPANGERAAATLSNSLHIIGPGQGHGMAPRGCVKRLIAEFVAAGSVADLDPSCVDVLEAAPFFVRLSGPEP
ncbi:MAG: alpha/beta hydrolase [Myxococcota bacterium]